MAPLTVDFAVWRAMAFFGEVTLIATHGYLKINGSRRHCFFPCMFRFLIPQIPNVLIFFTAILQSCQNNRVEQIFETIEERTPMKLISSKSFVCTWKSWLRLNKGTEHRWKTATKQFLGKHVAHGSWVKREFTSATRVMIEHMLHHPFFEWFYVPWSIDLSYSCNPFVLWVATCGNWKALKEFNSLHIHPWKSLQAARLSPRLSQTFHIEAAHFLPPRQLDRGQMRFWVTIGHLGWLVCNRNFEIGSRQTDTKHCGFRQRPLARSCGTVLSTVFSSALMSSLQILTLFSLLFWICAGIVFRAEKWEENYMTSSPVWVISYQTNSEQVCYIGQVRHRTIACSLKFQWPAPSHTNME